MFPDTIQSTIETTTSETTTALSPPLTGKALACFNSLTHGGAANNLFIPGENPDDFFALLENNFKDYLPATDENAGLVTDAVLARWFLLRRQRAYSDFEHTLHGVHPGPTWWGPADLDRLNLFDRYKTQAERALQRALTNVRYIRKEATQEQRWQELLALRKQRFELDRQRFLIAREKADQLAAKLQKKAERKAAIAKQFAEYLALQQQIQRESEVTVDEEYGPVIPQRIYLTVENGVTEIEPGTHMDNNEVRRIMRQRHTYDPQPALVLRHFQFPDGIPPEYEWIIEENGETELFEEYVYPLSFEEWEKVAQAEDESEHPINHLAFLRDAKREAK